jgi:para-nitrobenzyl esterase
MFGYLYLGALGDARYAASGNVGQLDLVQALQWVREHAAIFGGDRGNITVFGQSGGGAKIATLMAMPAARGLFQRVDDERPAGHRSRPACRRAARGDRHADRRRRGPGGPAAAPATDLLAATRARDPSR